MKQNKVLFQNNAAIEHAHLPSSRNSNVTDFTSKFNKSPSSMICDSVPIAQLYHTFPQLMK